MNALWIIGATVAAVIADAMSRDPRTTTNDHLPAWVAKLLGR